MRERGGVGGLGQTADKRRQVFFVAGKRGHDHGNTGRLVFANQLLQVAFELLDAKLIGGRAQRDALLTRHTRHQRAAFSALATLTILGHIVKRRCRANASCNTLDQLIQGEAPQTHRQARQLWRQTRRQRGADAQHTQVFVMPSVNQHGVRFDGDDFVGEVQQRVAVDGRHGGSDDLNRPVGD